MCAMVMANIITNSKATASIIIHVHLMSNLPGDSGGPLITTDSQSPKLIALTSFSPSYLCYAGVPNVFTRTSYYKDWIKTITGVECKN